MFFDVLFEVTTIYPEVIKDDCILVYKSFKYILTSIIDDKKNEKKVVQNIVDNLQSQMIRWESTSLINREINGKFHELNSDIFAIPNDLDPDGEFTKFMYYNGSTELICRETAKKNLINGITN